MFGFGKKKPQEVKLNTDQYSFVVDPEQNILDAALKAGVPFPHDCRVGSCGSCACKLTSGKIKPTADFSYVLDGKQLKDGMILACQSRAKTPVSIDVEIDSDAKASVTKSYEGIVKKVTPLTHDIMELTIGIDGLEHNGMAGQYSELLVKQVGNSRSYSFAKAPSNENPEELSFFIRNVPKGRFSKWLFGKDPTGQKLEVNTPFGSFYYRDGKGPMVCIAGGSGMSAVKAILEQAAIDQVERDAIYLFGSFYYRDGKGPMVCIAGGSGMSAVKAILEQAAIDQVERDAIYLFGARTQEDIYSRSDLEDIQKKWNPNFKFEFVYVLNMEPEDSDWTGARGMVTDFLKSDYIEKGKLNMKECQGYLCGPPPMIDAAIKEFTAEGMPNEEIFFDKFLDSGSK